MIVTDTGKLIWSRDDHAGFGLMINAEALMSYLGGKIYETLRNQILEFQREVKQYRFENCLYKCESESH